MATKHTDEMTEDEISDHMYTCVACLRDDVEYLLNAVRILDRLIAVDGEILKRVSKRVGFPTTDEIQ